MFQKRGGGRVDKITKLEGLSGVRVNSLFFQALNLFSDDLAIWLMYIKFCRQMVSNLYKILCKMLGALLSLYIYPSKRIRPFCIKEMHTTFLRLMQTFLHVFGQRCKQHFCSNFQCCQHIVLKQNII